MDFRRLLKDYLKYVARKAEYANLDIDYFLGKDFSELDYRTMKELRDGD